MTEAHSDGVADEIAERIRGQVRIAVTLAGMAAENAAKERERSARIAQTAAGAAAQQALAMKEADRAFAVGRLSQVTKDEWWDKATPGDVQLAWQDAASWREHDPSGRAARYAEQIKEQLSARYGVDPDAQSFREPTDLAEARKRRDLQAGQLEATVTVAATEDRMTDRDPVAGGRDVPGVARPVSLTEAEQQARFQLRQQFGPDWAGRADLVTALPKTVEVSVFEKESDKYYSVPVQRLLDWERARVQREGPVTAGRDAPAAGVPSVQEMMARLRSAGVPGPAVEGALLADVATVQHGRKTTGHAQVGGGRRPPVRQRAAEHSQGR